MTQFKVEHKADYGEQREAILRAIFPERQALQREGQEFPSYGVEVDGVIVDIYKNSSEYLFNNVGGVSLTMRPFGFKRRFIIRRVALRADGTLDLDAVARKLDELRPLAKEQVERRERAQREREEQHGREAALIRAARLPLLLLRHLWEEASGGYRLELEHLSTAQVQAIGKALQDAGSQGAK